MNQLLNDVYEEQENRSFNMNIIEKKITNDCLPQQTTTGYDLTFKLPSLAILNNSKILNLLPMGQETSSSITNACTEIGYSDFKRFEYDYCLESNFIDHVRYNVNTIFTFSRNNNVFCVITTDCCVNFSIPAMKVLHAIHGTEKVKETVRNIFNYTTKLRETYYGTEAEESQSPDGLINDIVLSIFKGLDASLKQKNNFTSEQNLLVHINRSIKRSIENIIYSGEGYIKQQLLINSNQMYRSFISRFVTVREQEKVSSFNNGMIVGSKILSSLRNSGYTFNNEDECWNKTVNIKPKLCTGSKNGTLYKLPEKWQIYTIERLKFEPSNLTGGNFVIQGTGRHPNMDPNGNWLCLGDDLPKKFRKLLINQSTTIEQYSNFILSIEETMQIINWHSSYWNMATDMKDEDKKKYGENSETSPVSVLEPCFTDSKGNKESKQTSLNRI